MNVIETNRYDYLRRKRYVVHEFNLVAFAIVVNMHDSPHVSGGEPFFRHGFSKHYDVVFFDHCCRLQVCPCGIFLGSFPVFSEC